MYVSFSLLLGYGPSFIPYLILKFTSAWSDRNYLDEVLRDNFGEFKISESVSDEVLVILYDWNSE